MCTQEALASEFILVYNCYVHDKYKKYIFENSHHTFERGKKMKVNNKNQLYSNEYQIKENENTKNLHFKKTIFFFYSACIKRVNDSRLEKKLKQIEVCNTEDRALVSNFFNGNCTKNNPYLISKKLMGYNKDWKSFATGEDGEYIGILHKLNFNSVKEILWGTDEEIENYLQTLYLLIMEELPKNCPEYYLDWEYVLFDYVPYSKYKTLYDIKNDLKISLLDTYGINDEEVCEAKIFIHQINAMIMLLEKEKFKSDFKEIFIDFAIKQKSFTHIDKKFEEDFIIPKFIPLLKKYKPKHENSLGLRVRDLLNNDLRCVPELISLKHSEKPHDDINRMLNSATSRYITELEKIYEKEYHFLFH